MPTRGVAWPAFSVGAPTGAVELAVAEAVHGERPRPARVTQLIGSLFETIGAESASIDLARSLAAGTREWLVQQAAARFRPEPDWLSVPCAQCGAVSDLPVALADLPRGEPEAGFPRVEVETALGTRRFDLPNGLDEEALAVTPGDPRRVLAARCGTAADAETEAARFGEADLAAIDAAMDAAMPEPATALSFECPECGTANTAPLDPLGYAFPSPQKVYGEVHQIAAGYGWSEAAILALPMARRQAYLRLIAAKRA
ncbi:MAG: hypothetical protein V4574_06175 [Pseudomonadota bacterium]